MQPFRWTWRGHNKGGEKVDRRRKRAGNACVKRWRNLNSIRCSSDLRLPAYLQQLGLSALALTLSLQLFLPRTVPLMQHHQQQHMQSRHLVKLTPLCTKTLASLSLATFVALTQTLILDPPVPEVPTLIQFHLLDPNFPGPLCSYF